MLTVTFKSPIVIDEKNLSSLLSLAGVAATVEPYLNGVAKKPGRKPAVAAAPAEPAPVEDGHPVSAQEAAPVKPAGARRGRKSNAQKEAEAAAASGGEQASTDSLLARFSGLIDTDFEGAKGILDKLGVERFSDLAESDYPAFDSALTELGA